VFEHRWISQGKRLVCFIHGSILNLPYETIVLQKRLDDQPKISKFKSKACVTADSGRQTRGYAEAMVRQLSRRRRGKHVKQYSRLFD
jgi:hypothetical protein